MSTTQDIPSPVAANAALLMNRRDAVRRLAIVMGVAMIGSEAFLRGETVAKIDAKVFTDEDRLLLDAVGETIIPAGSPENIKKVAIGAFMTKQVSDCYSDADHATFAGGLVKLDAGSKAKYGSPFLGLSSDQRTEYLNALDAESKVKDDAKDKDGKPVKKHDRYFHMMKELAVLGYFSSEVGCTQSVKYIEVPTRYDGDVPFKKGDTVYY